MFARKLSAEFSEFKFVALREKLWHSPYESTLDYFVFIFFLVLQSEVSRREVELRKLGEDLVDIRRKNKMVQDKGKFI